LNPSKDYLPAPEITLKNGNFAGTNPTTFSKIIKDRVTYEHLVCKVIPTKADEDFIISFNPGPDKYVFGQTSASFKVVQAISQERLEHVTYPKDVTLSVYDDSVMFEIKNLPNDLYSYYDQGDVRNDLFVSILNESKTA